MDVRGYVFFTGPQSNFLPRPGPLRRRGTGLALKAKNTGQGQLNSTYVNGYCGMNGISGAADFDRRGRMFL
jgi:hypothetical protein